jgi:hypothetical protein
MRTGDPHGDQRQGGNGMSYLSMYAEAGIYIGTEGIPRGPGAVQMRIEKMQQYFRVRDTGFLGMKNRPKWVISQNCPWLTKELRRLQWGAYESDKKAYESNKLEVVKSKEDHAFDSAGYFATLMPDLRPEDTSDSGKRKTLDFGEMLKLAEEGELRLAETAGQPQGLDDGSMRTRTNTHDGQHRISFPGGREPGSEPRREHAHQEHYRPVY